jgi:hypothetical protein
MSATGCSQPAPPVSVTTTADAGDGRQRLRGQRHLVAVLDASVAELVAGRSRRRGQQGGAICEVLVRGPRC